MSISNISKKSFGSYIRSLRLDLNIGQRELAEKIGIAPSYLNDIEKEKRSSPKQKIIKKIATQLKANINDLNDLAGISKKNLAPDIIDFIEKNPAMKKLMRTIKDNNLENKQIDSILKNLLIKIQQKF
jgi:transcriptional regulator with XRE-family HTH domain